MVDKNNTGMEKPEMKRILNRCSRQEPAHCAMGVGENNALALLVMDRKRQPRALEGELKKDFPDVKNTRFGTVFVDEAEDGTMAQFQLNRAVSGMAKRLVKTLKKTGFTKVRILSEDGSLMEELQEADEEGALEAAQAAGPAAQATPVQGAVPAAPPPPPPGDAPAAEVPANPADLSKRLAALAARIPGVAGEDAARKATLMKLATDANVNIKTNNLKYAANSLAQLEKALEGGAAAVPPAPPAPPPGEAPGAGAAANPADLAKRLAALAARIPGAAGEDAARKATLLKLATDANVNIKTNNLTYAANSLAQLEKALEGGAAAASAVPPAPPPGEAPGAAAAANPADLAKRLAALAARIPGAAGDDAAHKTALLKLATDANVNIKTNNLTYAANSLAQLEKALGAGAGVALPSDLGKARSTWAGVRQQVVTDVTRLKAALVAAYDRQPVLSEVVTKFDTTVAPILAQFDGRVGDALDSVISADAAGRGAMLDRARTVVKDTLAFASSDTLIGDLDDNPFVTLDIRAAATAALAEVQQAVQ